jgi:hypothetical protein
MSVCRRISSGARSSCSLGLSAFACCSSRKAWFRVYVSLARWRCALHTCTRAATATGNASRESSRPRLSQEDAGVAVSLSGSGKKEVDARGGVRCVCVCESTSLSPGGRFFCCWNLAHAGWCGSRAQKDGILAAGAPPFSSLGCELTVPVHDGWWGSRAQKDLSAWQHTVHTSTTSAMRNHQDFIVVQQLLKDHPRRFFECK